MRPDGSRAYSGTATAAVPHYRPPCRRGGPPVVDVPHSGRRAEGRVPLASGPSMRPDGFPRLQWHRHGRRAILPAAVPKGRAPCYITSTAVVNTPILFSFPTSTVRWRCVLRCVACARVHAAPASPDVPDIVIAAAAGSDC